MSLSEPVAITPANAAILAMRLDERLILPAFIQGQSGALVREPGREAGQTLFTAAASLLAVKALAWSVLTVFHAFSLATLAMVLAVGMLFAAAFMLGQRLRLMAARTYAERLMAELSLRGADLLAHRAGVIDLALADMAQRHWRIALGFAAAAGVFSLAALPFESTGAYGAAKFASALVIGGLIALRLRPRDMPEEERNLRRLVQQGMMQPKTIW